VWRPHGRKNEGENSERMGKITLKKLLTGDRWRPHGRKNECIKIQSEQTFLEIFDKNI